VRESQAAGRDERARFQRGIRNAAISGIRPTPTRLAVDYALARSLFYKKKEKAREREREREIQRDFFRRAECEITNRAVRE